MLGITGRRVLLSIHILLNSILIGGFAAILFLNLVKQNTTTSDNINALNLAIFKIHDQLVINAAFGVIITGLLFSLFTKWGFFDFYWVTIKWISLAILFFLIISFMGPVVNGMAAISDVEGIQALMNPEYLKYENDVNILPILILLILISIITISVFKPWGKRKKLFQLKRKVVLGIGIVSGVMVISSAFFQFNQLQSYRTMPVKDFNLNRIANGTYIGVAEYAYNYQIEVTIKEHRIDQIRIIENRKSHYAKLAEMAITKVISAQTPNVTAVTGATTTSKCFLKAIENALEKGGSSKAEIKSPKEGRI